MLPYRKWVISMSSQSSKTNTYRPALTPSGNDRQQHLWELKMIATFPSQRLACEDEIKDGAWDVFEVNFETQTLAFRPLSEGTSDPLRSSNTERVGAIRCAPCLDDRKHSGKVEHAKPTRGEAIWRGPAIDRSLSLRQVWTQTEPIWLIPVKLLLLVVVGTSVECFNVKISSF